MDDLYREIIIERYKNPIHKGKLDKKDLSFEDDNPLCGDFIHIDLKTDENGLITNAVFDGQGCAISQASADLLLDEILGKNVNEVKQYDTDKILELIGIELGPVRLKCALLPLKVLKAAIYGIEKSTD